MGPPRSPHTQWGTNRTAQPLLPSQLNRLNTLAVAASAATPAVSVGCLAAPATVVAHRTPATREALDYARPLASTGCPASSGGRFPSNLLGVLPGYTGERVHLRVDFPLRCFQRFFVPDVATEPAGRPTTPPPAVRPARSSRTRASSRQPSKRAERIETELSHDVLNPARVPL